MGLLNPLNVNIWGNDRPHWACRAHCRWMPCVVGLLGAHRSHSAGSTRWAHSSGWACWGCTQQVGALAVGRLAVSSWWACSGWGKAFCEHTQFHSLMEGKKIGATLFVSPLGKEEGIGDTCCIPSWKGKGLRIMPTPPGSEEFRRVEAKCLHGVLCTYIIGPVCHHCI